MDDIIMCIVVWIIWPSQFLLKEHACFPVSSDDL